MKRTYVHFLNDIRNSGKRIMGYVEGMDYPTFAQNDLVQDAVMRNLEIIGEAAKNVPEDVRNKYDIPWKSIVGLRNIVIHTYFGIDLENIWSIIQNDLPKILEKIGPEM
jgi:uncharacterized protein with HEPN domain